MKHWHKYIAKHPIYDDYAVSADFNYNMVVVIPCYNEPNLIATLASLTECSSASKPVAVLIVINSSEIASEEVVLRNRNTYQEVLSFAKKNNNKLLSFHVLLCEELPRKHAGVGLARKIGMEWAIRGFSKNNNDKGIIISLDADCYVSKNYLVSIEKEFSNHNIDCCVINFEHWYDKDDADIKTAVDQYERYIRYYRKCLKYIGFPYFYHTIGSAFAVSADAYVKVGGIGRQQGGEDFYFLHKVFQFGTTFELMETFVYPKARFSDRIPFGTGPALEKIITSNEGVLRVYSIESFKALKIFFDLRLKLYQQTQHIIYNKIDKLPLPVQDFLSQYDLIKLIRDCNENSATVEKFEKRFFHHFNGFVIIKYLNFVHPQYFELTPIEEAVDRVEKEFEI